MRACPACELRLPQPDTAARVLQTQRHMLRKELPVEVLQECIEANDPELRVVLQECAQNISFIPRPALINPRARIFKWIEDVVDVDVDARRERRKDFEKDSVHIAAGLTDMRGIDEQNVVFR